MGKDKEILEKELHTQNHYYRWLVSKTGHSKAVKNGYSYRNLFRQLMKTRFTWKLPMDENRASDGIALRTTFLSKINAPLDLADTYLKGPCSVFEMLIALSDRICMDIFDKDVNDGTSEWFWIMIRNLGLFKCIDGSYDAEYVRKVLDNMMERTYTSKGKGGLFPLKTCKEDQRNVEIWYQMQSFVIENFEI